MADPQDELFDLCDRLGRPLGTSRPRALVHRDGDWHRSFHCWVVSTGSDGIPHLILQRRAPHKQTWPNLWDVSVGGHYTSGEDVEGGLREIHEELGVVVTRDELVQLGRRREEVVYENGLIDREVQDVYLLWRAIALSDLRPDPDEVAAVALVPARDLMALARGRVEAINVRAGSVRADRCLDPVELSLRLPDLVPASGNYQARIARLAVRYPKRVTLNAGRRWL